MLRAKITIPVQIVLSRIDYFPRHTKKDSFLSSGSRLQQRRVKTNLSILKGRAAMPEGAFGNTEKSFCGAGTRPFYSTGKASGFMLPDREPLLPLHHHRHLRWE